MTSHDYVSARKGAWLGLCFLILANYVEGGTGGLPTLLLQKLQLLVSSLLNRFRRRFRYPDSFAFALLGVQFAS